VAALADVLIHALRCLSFAGSLVMVECAVTRGDTYFRQAGIQVQPQVYLERVGYVDLLLDGWLVVELDGRHHAEWKQVQKDHRRNNESVLQGYTALRYYYADVVYGPQAMVEQVLAVLRRRR